MEDPDRSDSRSRNRAAVGGDPLERDRQTAGIWFVVPVAVAIAALLLASFSLVTNLLLVRELGAVRQETRTMLDEAIVALEAVTLGDVDFSYVFSDTVVYSGTIPLDETIVFPFQGTVPFQGAIPFQTVVPIAIDIPLFGRQVIRVPVNTTVNVDTAVDVSTTLTIPIAMDFPFHVEMPVEMPVELTISLDEQPALVGVLQQLREVLIQFRDRVLQ